MKNVIQFQRRKPTGEAERPTPSSPVVSFRYYRYRRKARAAGARMRECLDAAQDAAYRFGDALFSVLMTMFIGVLGMLAAVSVRALELVEKIRRNL